MSGVHDPVNECFIIPYKGGVESEEKSGFTLYVGEKVERFLSPEFEVPRTNVSIRVRVAKHGNNSTTGRPIQFILMKPVCDIIEVQINGMSAVLTCGPDSFVWQKDEHSFWKHGSGTGTVAKYEFSFSQFPVPLMSCSLPSLDRRNVTLVTKTLGPNGQLQTVLTDAALLTQHSDVIKNLIDPNGAAVVLDFTDFETYIVIEMLRFMRHGYCGLWYKEYPQLTAIAHKFKIVGMIALAAEKKKLLDRLFLTSFS